MVKPTNRYHPLLFGKFLLLPTLLATLTLSSGCSKEKAKALQVAAATFASETSKSIDTLENLLLASIAMPTLDDDDKILRDLIGLYDQPNDTSLYSFGALHEITKAAPGTENAINTYATQLNNIRQSYFTFSRIFESLDRGNLLAGDKVIKSQAYALKLSKQLLKFAEMIDTGTIRITDNKRRILLDENLQKTYTVKDKSARDAELAKHSKEIRALIAAEAKMASELKSSLLHSANLGADTLILLNSYQKMSVADILALIKENVSFASNIPSNEDSLKKLLTGISSKIESVTSDPNFSNVLALGIN